jgi:predicted O-methyltransferase YrrM
MIPQIELNAIHDIEGIYLPNPYLGAHQTGILVALALNLNARTCIEFGTNRGLTAQAILKKVKTLERYIGVDVPADHKPVLRQQDTEIPESAGINAVFDKRFELIIRSNGTLDLAPQDFPIAEMVFIDGDHSFDVVTHDSHLAKSIVCTGGVITWHDYLNPEVEVTKALDTLYGLGWPIRHIVHTWLAMMKVE